MAIGNAAGMVRLLRRNVAFMSWRHRFTHQIPSWAVLTFARRYVAGDSLAAALERADELWKERGLRSTLDVLGEHVERAQQARQALAVYAQAAEQVAERPYVSLSIKPGHFGHYVDPALCRRQVQELASRCRALRTKLTIDMEDVDLTSATLDLYRGLLPEHPGLGIVLQTKLHRTATDLESLRGLGSRVRLCIGVYDVTSEHGLRDKREAKARLIELLPSALEICQLVELATHDLGTIAQARSTLAQLGVGPERVEFQMLLGVPRSRVQDELVAAGWPVRLYLPFAESWPQATAYLRRRLAESPSMAALVLRNLASPDG